MTHTEIAFANERAIIADMLINLLTNVRLTYLPDLEPGEAQELLLTGAHILIAQLGNQPPTAAEISSVIGRPLDVVTQRLDQLIARGYVEHRANRYEMTAKLNVPNLQRQVRADIFLGKIKRWDDPALKELNPQAKLPAAAITVVHRADGSGTTFNWTSYLSKVSPEWKNKMGAAAFVDWSVGLGGKGNSGVAALVIQTKNSIGYVEYAYTLQNKMTHGQVRNRAGTFVKPEAKSFQAAAESADWGTARDFNITMTDTAGAEAYPITATVFILMYKKPKSPTRTSVAMDFFRWALASGQQQASALDYVPLPENLVGQIEAYWKTQFAPGS